MRTIYYSIFIVFFFYKECACAYVNGINIAVNGYGLNHNVIYSNEQNSLNVSLANSFAYDVTGNLTIYNSQGSPVVQYYYAGFTYPANSVAMMEFFIPANTIPNQASANVNVQIILPNGTIYAAQTTVEVETAPAGFTTSPLSTRSISTGSISTGSISTGSITSAFVTSGIISTSPLTTHVLTTYRITTLGINSDITSVNSDKHEIVIATVVPLIVGTFVLIVLSIVFYNFFKARETNKYNNL